MSTLIARKGWRVLHKSTGVRFGKQELRLLSVLPPSRLLLLSFVLRTMQSSASCSSPTPTKIVIPDLVSHCEFTYRVNPHCAQAAPASEEWLHEGGSLSARKREAFHGLKAGLLTSMCYPDAGYDELRVCCDFMNYLVCSILFWFLVIFPHSWVCRSSIWMISRMTWTNAMRSQRPIL
jgi:hypothetical protein